MHGSQKIKNFVMKQKFALLVAFLLIVGLIVALQVARTKQEQRSRASETVVTTPGAYGYDDYAGGTSTESTTSGAQNVYGGQISTPSATATPTAAFAVTPSPTIAPTQAPLATPTP